MTRSARSPLSRETVADAALAIADEEGLDSVTIRKLADAFGVTPMALYWHFRTKEALLEGVADRVLDSVVVPTATENWAEDLRAVLTALVAALSQHPQLASVVPSRMFVHPAGLALSELSISALAAAHIPREETAWLASHAFRVALALVTGDPVNYSGMSAEDGAAFRRRQRAELLVLPPETYPAIAQHADPLVYCEDPERFFRLGIDHYIFGVEAIAMRFSKRK